MVSCELWLSRVFLFANIYSSMKSRRSVCLARIDETAGSTRHGHSKSMLRVLGRQIAESLGCYSLTDVTRRNLIWNLRRTISIGAHYPTFYLLIRLWTEVYTLCLVQVYVHILAYTNKVK